MSKCVCLCRPRPCEGMQYLDSCTSSLSALESSGSVSTGSAMWPDTEDLRGGGARRPRYTL